MMILMVRKVMHPQVAVTKRINVEMDCMMTSLRQRYLNKRRHMQLKICCRCLIDQRKWIYEARKTLIYS
jgi:hypothetical protein